jgi:ABC-type glycerol-3-phosphate transport system substrate-binding protein
VKKTTLILLLVSFIFVPYVMASGGQEETATVSDWTKDPITMKIEGSGWILKKFPIQEAADRFMQDHPNVTIEVSSNQDDTLNSYMLNWAVGDADVDLAFGGAASQVAKLAAKNLLMPWNDFYSGDFDAKDFLTHSVETAKKGGEYFAIPFMEEAMSLQVNRGLMEEAGLVNSDGTPMYPANLDEMADFAGKMTKGSGEVKDIYGFSWNLTNFGDQQMMCAVNALGGKVYNDDGSPNLEAPEYLDIFNFIAKVNLEGWATKGTISDTNAGRSGLKAGTVAMIFEAASRAIEAKATLGDDAMMIPFHGMEKNGTFIFAHYAYVPRTSKVQEAVKAFMREQVFTADFAAPAAEQYGKLPSYIPLYSGLSSDFEQIKKWMALPGTIGDMSWVEGSKLNALFYELEQLVATGGITPEEAVERLATEGGSYNLAIVE